MKKYELYKFMIISLASDRVRRCRCMSCQSSHGRHVISLRLFFFRSDFLETADQTSQLDYRPIVISNRSIGTPLILSKLACHKANVPSESIWVSMWLIIICNLCLSSEWVFGPRSDNGRSKSEVNCISISMNEMSELSHPVDTRCIVYNHSDCPSTVKPEELVVTIDETLQLPREAYSGT